MKAPGRLSDKEEDSMSSLSLRKVAAAVVLLVILCLAAVPAAAQPRGTHEASRVETDFASRVWLWVVELWGPSAHHAQEKSLAAPQTSTDQSPLAPGALNRGGTYDPNG
jgi:hypothetical protein